MEISVISFTEQGRKLADRIKDVMPEYVVGLFEKPKQGVVIWAGEQFAEKKALIFIGACGIAVRAAAPFVKDKLSDSPVIVIDEKGQYVIPILSGHVGGANALAELLAERLGAAVVITTATDINQKFAADIFAKRNNLQILNKEGIAKVSSKVLRGEKITVSIEDYKEREREEGKLPEEIEMVSYPPNQDVDVLVSADAENGKTAVLKLKPKEYMLGIGCKKGKPKEEIDAFIRENLKRTGIIISDIAGIASIEQKKYEPGICAWAKEAGITFFTFSEDELRTVDGNFHGSDFVRQTVGVDNVCERAAMKACGEGGMLILDKQMGNGLTLAIAKRKWSITWK